VAGYSIEWSGERATSGVLGTRKDPTGGRGRTLSEQARERKDKKSAEHLLRA